MESKRLRHVRITAGVELVVVISLIGLMSISILVPWAAPRAVLGIPFAIFVPGYTFASALFPRKTPISLLERVIIGVALSLVLVALIGFSANFTPWGLRLIPMFIVLSILSFSMSLASYLRRRTLPEGERFDIVIPVKAPIWNKSTKASKILSIALMASIVVAVGSLAYGIISPKVGESYTDFYVIGSHGKAADYPQTIKVGDTASVTAGVVNHEHRTIDYHVDVLIGGARTFSSSAIRLADGEKWEAALPLSPSKTGMRQKVQIDLYRPEDAKPYQYLILWVDVPESAAAAVN